MVNETLNVSGMNCAHCEKAVTDGLTEIGVQTVIASADDNTVKISYDPQKVTLSKIKFEIIDMGYEVE